jgi:hypothetical protein
VVSRERQRRVIAPLSVKDWRQLATLLRRLHEHVVSSYEYNPQVTIAEIGQRVG